MKSERLLFLTWSRPMKAITCLIFCRTSFSLANMSSILLFVRVKMGEFLANRTCSEKIDVKCKVEECIRTWLKSSIFTARYVLKWLWTIVLNYANGKSLIPFWSAVITNSWSAGMYTLKHVGDVNVSRSQNDLIGRPPSRVKQMKGLALAYKIYLKLICIESFSVLSTYAWCSFPARSKIEHCYLIWLATDQWGS